MRIFTDMKTNEKYLTFNNISGKFKPKAALPIFDLVLCFLSLVGLIYIIYQGYMLNCIMYVFSYFNSGLSVSLNLGAIARIVIIIWIVAILYHLVCNRVINWQDQCFFALYRDKIVFNEKQLIMDLSAKLFYTYSIESISKITETRDTLIIRGSILYTGSFSRKSYVHKLVVSKEYDNYEKLRLALSTFNNKEEYHKTWDMLVEEVNKD